jgi:hypothetical protein
MNIQVQLVHQVSISSTCSQAVVTSADPKSAKMTVKASVLFALLGSVRVKAAIKMLVKLA